MGYPDDPLQWMPKWRDLDLIEHRRHREAVEAAVAGLDEGDDIVLIGGALAGTSTARRAIINAWAPGATLEWHSPFADDGEWLDEQDVWSALLSEGRTHGDIAWTDYAQCWELSEHEVLFTTEEAAEYLRLSPRTLERYRVTGEGPNFLKLGRRVFYRRSDLDAWRDARLRRSTSDPGTQG